ncbi:septum formation inhibitor Maf [Antarcticibacterium flavum]|uniref:Septum formation inhibitor Maf n=1 Tax=Antarcticibacterium flavum TaxID=2058175 RepID=A0A5B7WYK7_9FLAO|nr:MULTISPECIES: septum formation inhibitor Maf [Antarcticibacterium]MCM4159018.1 septum formation inhibitor Maf [Antarcticibacterium sp. W02-3]QCY68266.1 septum formation inhibitor Maf [Antarcticibacterium flavum]
MSFHPALRFFLLFSGILLSGCKGGDTGESILPERELSQDFKDYWFAGEAEITSYDLLQYRYGEPREGEAALIFVTEDFLKEEQVKANRKSENSVPVLKLNATKNFLTGIYPYSIMQSTFYPLEGNSHALKVTASIQEWCGQVYMQLNNRNKYEILSHSYFEGEEDQFPSLSRYHLENEVWNQIRIDPQLLPTGNIKMIPSFEYIRLAHIEIKAYDAFAEFYMDKGLSVYRISYPKLQRKLLIYHHPVFPHPIEKWEEVSQRDGEEVRSTATKKSRLKIDYWTRNSNNDLPLRDNLKLN